MKKKIGIITALILAVISLISCGALAFADDEDGGMLYYIAFDSMEYKDSVGNAYGFDSTEYIEVGDSDTVSGAIRLMYEKSPYPHMGTYTSKGYQGEFDPYFYLPMYKIKQDIKCDEIAAFVITVRVPESVNHSDRAMVFFDTDENPNIDGNGDFFSAASAYKKTEDFQNILFYAPKSNKVWSGILQSLRMDPFSQANDDMDYIDVAGIAFFSDRQAAKSFDGNYVNLKNGNRGGGIAASSTLLSATGCLIAAISFSGGFCDRRTKRIAALLLALMVCTACFTACDVADHDADGGPDVRPTSDVIGSPQPTEVPLSGVFVESKANDEYRYDVYEDHVKITKYIGFKTDVTVPEQIDGLPVRIIGYKAFFRNYCFAAQDAAHHTEIGIETLTLPDSVYYIEDYALAGLEEAVTINFGTGLISIGNDALQNCFLLRNLNFSGDNLRYIGAWAFSACRSLENVSLPEGVASIGEAAFICCRSLKHINISDNAETGDGAFFACASMI